MLAQAAAGNPAHATALWSRFAAAEELGPYLQAWLALQCAELEEAVAAAVLWEQEDGGFAPLAVWPSVQRDVTHLGDLARRALVERRGLQALSGDAGAPHAHLAYPIVVDDRPLGVAVVDLRSGDAALLQRAMQRLHWGAGWLLQRALQLRAERQTAEIERVQTVLGLVAAAGETGNAREASLALANAVAERLDFGRAMLGVIKPGGRVELWAISKAAWFDKRTQESAEIENLMEEALDQGATLCWPVPDTAPYSAYRVRVAHEAWCRQRAGVAVASLPLIGRDGAVAMLSVEREAGRPLLAEDLRRLEALALLAGPLLEDKLALERWVAGRLRNQLSQLRARLFGRGHGSWKLGAALALIVLLLLAVLKQDYRVTARSVVEGVVQRAAVAPFEGFVASAPVRAGERVRAGQVLATLDEKDLRLEAARWQGEYEQAEQKLRDAMAKRDRAAMAQLGAQVRQAQAQLALVEQKLQRTAIVAPLDGLVVSGDLSQKLGSPVQTGDLLFEVAPLDAYRVILQVDERDIGELRNQQRGRLVLNGWSREPLDFVVSNVTAVAEQQDGRNVFRVEAQLLAGAELGLRPGMEGVGKVEVGERRIWWVWTHRLTDWIRLTLWRWLP